LPEERSPDGEPQLPVVPSSTPPPGISDRALPVISRQADAGGTTHGGVELQIRTRSEAPILGVRLSHAPLMRQSAAMTERASASLEPAVQRVEFVSPALAPARRPSASSAALPEADRSAARHGPTPPVSTPAPSTTVKAPTGQRLLSHDGKQGSNPSTSSPLALSRRERQVHEAVAEAAVQRLESQEPSTLGAANTFERTSLRPEMHSEPTKSEVGGLAGYVPMASAVPETSVSAPAPKAPIVPAVPELPLGPAVIAEPWTGAARTPAAGPAVPTRQGAPLTVSRLAADATTYPTSRFAGANPTIAVGPSIPLQRVAGLRVPSSGPRSSPLIVSHPTMANEASSESGSARGMSFPSMFGAVGGSVSGSAAEDGFTSVQLQSDGEPTPAASDSAAAAGTASTPPISSAVAPATAGTPSADLDELARRLYEPLTARLRAELWLDRERAGVMSDL
jgi:hypothetical protein